jgi:hypothetical protein
VAFEIFQAKEQTAVDRLAQAVHQGQIVVADRRVALFDPLDMVAANALANLLAGPRPTAAGASSPSAARLRHSAASSRVRPWGRKILLRPAIFGQVVDDA